MSDTVPNPRQVVSVVGLKRVLGAAARFIKVQGTQASTYRGLSLLASAIGIYLRPELVAAISAAGMGISGLIAVLCPDTPAGPSAE